MQLQDSKHGPPSLSQQGVAPQATSPRAQIAPLDPVVELPLLVVVAPVDPAPLEELVAVEPVLPTEVKLLPVLAPLVALALLNWPERVVEAEVAPTEEEELPF